ncbi:F-box associated interaction domain [Arabidopsis suecica]|uniref:F-box associated interaction domain n=1 Tax=Arabidopsis suecica TaxID=45249 RepID=A0A8T2BLB7_ARASU|nr:F-box associated interaction domain [Arabidopsis suecica]
MSSPVMNQDMIQEVLSYIPASKIGKFRLLNKECNKRSYESWFLNLNLRRTNCISGYFLQRYEEGYKTNFFHESSDLQNNGVSIDFLPHGKVKIEACDASHGILLCVINPELIPEYIVCKPTTKQYQIIPNTKVGIWDVSFGLAVIGLNPFRYKILRLSQSRRMCMSRGMYYVNHRTFTCEVFDSDSFTWKRLENMRIPRTDGLIISHPVQASGLFLHWRSRNNNVIRFCLKTETWSFFHTPNFGVFSELVRYEGKLGAICQWTNKDQENVHGLWVLKSSFEKSWEKVKDIKSIGEDYITWTPRNDVVLFCNWDRVCLYNINTEKLKLVHTNKGFASYVCFPFCSDYEKVDMDERRNRPTLLTKRKRNRSTNAN